MGVAFLILGLVIWALLAIWPAYVAKKRGYSFILFLLASLVVSWLLMLIVAYIIPDKTLTAKDKADDLQAEKALTREEPKKQ